MNRIILPLDFLLLGGSSLLACENDSAMNGKPAPDDLSSDSTGSKDLINEP